MKITETDILNLLYSVALPGTYKPPTYTCIKEFTDSFLQKNITEFVAPVPDAEYPYIPDPDFPRIYNKHYKKTLLSTL